MTQFRIPEIHCDGCVRALTAAVRGLDSQAALQADLVTKQVQVHTIAPVGAVADAMRQAGFTVEPV